MTGAQDAKQLRRRRGVIERVYERNQQFRVVEQREQVGQPLVRVSALAGRPSFWRPVLSPRPDGGDDDVAQRQPRFWLIRPGYAVKLAQQVSRGPSQEALAVRVQLVSPRPQLVPAPRPARRSSGCSWLAAHRRPGYLDNHEIGVPPCLGDSPQAHPVISVVHPARTSCCLTSQPRIMPRARSRASHWRTGGPLAGSDSLRFAPAVSGCHAAGVQVKVGGGDAQGTVSGARCAQR